MSYLYDTLARYGDVYALSLHTDRDILKELKKYNWVQYNPRKNIPRRGLSITSLDGGLSGIPDLDSVKEYNIKHIEDCAQSFGATYKDKQTGSYGDMGCYSFFPTKNLGCFGDGGLIAVKSKKYYNILKKLRTHGGTKRNQHDLIGYNSRLDEIQAAVLNIKLNYLQSFIKKRKKIAESYSSIINNDKFKLPFALKNSNHTYNQFTIRVKQRGKLEAYLKQHQIPYGVYYSKPMYKYNAYKKFSYKSLPMVEKVSKQCLSLPIYPELSLKYVEFIGKTLNNYE